MDEISSLTGAALGTVFIVNGLVSALVAKGLLTQGEIGTMLGATLDTIDKAQTDDFPENAQIWADARMHVEQILDAHSTD